MYHINSDKRAQKSASLIAEGMLECLKKKAIDEISISDIQRVSSVGRSTFYRHFDNTADVLHYLCDQVFERANTAYAQLETLSADATTRQFIRLWMDNEVLLRAIVDCNRMDFIYQAHLKYLAPSMGHFFPDDEIDETQTDYMMLTLTACLSAFLTAWVKNGASENTDQLQRRLRQCFSMLGEMFR